MHLVTTPPLLMNMLISILLLAMDKSVIQTVLTMSVVDLCITLFVFGIVSVIMFLVMAYKARPLINLINNCSVGSSDDKTEDRQVDTSHSHTSVRNQLK